MANVMDEILESFYDKLSESDVVNEATIEELRVLFGLEKTLKPNDFVAIFQKAAKDGRRDSD